MAFSICLNTPTCITDNQVIAKPCFSSSWVQKKSCKLRGMQYSIMVQQVKKSGFAVTGKSDKSYNL